MLGVGSLYVSLCLSVLFLVFDVEVVMVVPLLFVLYGGVKVVGVVCLVAGGLMCVCIVLSIMGQ